ncbi:MAG: hypothetical protein WA722_14300, partial [Candidatus Sulfotelmatobacter sp.]
VVEPIVTGYPALLLATGMTVVEGSRTTLQGVGLAGQAARRVDNVGEEKDDEWISFETEKSTPFAPTPIGWPWVRLICPSAVSESTRTAAVLQNLVMDARLTLTYKLFPFT